MRSLSLLTSLSPASSPTGVTAAIEASGYPVHLHHDPGRGWSATVNGDREDGESLHLPSMASAVLVAARDLRDKTCPLKAVGS